jgi:hypothetical protein
MKTFKQYLALRENSPEAKSMANIVMRLAQVGQNLTPGQPMNQNQEAVELTRELNQFAGRFPMNRASHDQVMATGLTMQQVMAAVDVVDDLSYEDESLRPARQLLTNLLGSIPEIWG